MRQINSAELLAMVRLSGTWRKLLNIEETDRVKDLPPNVAIAMFELSTLLNERYHLDSMIIDLRNHQ